MTVRIEILSGGDWKLAYGPWDGRDPDAPMEDLQRRILEEFGVCAARIVVEAEDGRTRAIYEWEQRS